MFMKDWRLQMIYFCWKVKVVQYTKICGTREQVKVIQTVKRNKTQMTITATMTLTFVEDKQTASTAQLI